jgi:hypothetical protein
MPPRQRTLRLLPNWARWALAILVGVAVIATIVIVASRSGPESLASEAGSEAEADRLADTTIAEDQAPHSARLPASARPVAALEQAVARDMRRRIAGGQLAGPLQSITCRASGAASAGRDPYSCTVKSADIAYPIVAVLDRSAHELTWCKVDPPPSANAGTEIPVSASCEA